jgi:hypothetical protein
MTLFALSAVSLPLDAGSSGALVALSAAAMVVQQAELTVPYHR